jgi:hypothetical protein
MWTKYDSVYRWLGNYLVEEERGASDFRDDRYDVVRVSAAMMVLTNKGLFRMLFDWTNEDLKRFEADGWERWLEYPPPPSGIGAGFCVWSKVVDGRRYAFAVHRKS